MTTSYIEAIFNQHLGNHLLNTSYPLKPSDWYGYSKEGALKFSNAPIAFYIHIPFCKHLCKFCEYTRIMLPEPSVQSAYIETLCNDIEQFIKEHPSINLYGFDIGGGTPLALKDAVFETLIENISHIISNTKQTADFEPSIEGTFHTLSEQKIKVARQAGIQRLSLGLQSSSKRLMDDYERVSSSIVTMASSIEKIHSWGIEKVNIDIMYGLPGQSKSSIKADLEAIKALSPEQVTVYEFRCNQVNLEYNVGAKDRYEQYKILYNGLISSGYNADFGQNTFSRSKTDLGLSSYLRHRMIDGWQYKGFGISAQSMSDSGISYNIGKNQDKLINLIGYPTYEAASHYNLPPKELLNKYIAICGYYGSISIDAASRILQSDFLSYFKETIKFLIDNQLIEIAERQVKITCKGYENYGAILSLFTCASH